MSYEPTIWKKGDKVTSARLNKIENGIQGNDEALANKVDKVTGKGLSENDYTTAEKTKLAGIENGATNVAIDSTLTQEGRAADAKEVGDQLADVKRDLNDKANIDGTYDGMTVGNARQLLSEKYLLDEEPYLFRASGGDGSDRVEECLVGGSVGWNQLCNSASVTVTSGHKYISKVGSTWAVGASTGSAITGLTSGTDMVIDLTALFGSTIADYIYSLEQSTAGAGVAWFRKYFPEDYYEYSAPTLRHVEGVSQKEVVGFNQWDEEWEVGGISSVDGSPYADVNRIRSKNFTPVLPNTTYYIRIPSNVNPWKIAFYDGDKAFISFTGAGNRSFVIPANCHYLKIAENGTDYGTTYNHDICINLSDPTKNGVYEPYRKNIYPLDSSLTLRGVPKLTDGKMWFDGDKYLPSGAVARNTILRAYQSGDESLANAITDGTNTVVYSANASTEEATPYTALQLLDPHGTEEFVTTGIVPVGHESHYLENLRSKIEGLPRDFSTLIAPTEKEYKATQNYTVGSLLIVDNILYKVTSAIANGGTITPNTNATATTLAAVIAAL